MKEGLRDERDEIDRSLQSLIHSPDYSRRFLLDNERFVLASTGYPEYPVQLFQTSDYAIVLEGRLYALADERLSDEMSKLNRILFTENKNDSGRLTRWLLGTEGDFMIFVLNKSTSEIAILNDGMGRLPCYFFEKGETVMLSRELRFIANLVGEHKYDRMGIAQCLLFGYPWGNRTFLQNVKRLPPASIVRINVTKPEISLDILHTFNFEIKEHANRTVQENASELVTLFRESCRQRTDTAGTNIVSLSGGLDSRSVAAGLRDEGIPFLGATLLEHDKPTSTDLTCAGLLAKSCGWNWEVYKLDAPRGRHLLQMLKTKSGLSHFGMSYILDFFEKIRQRHGSEVVYLTGDGGDKTLPDLRSTKRLRRIEDVANALFEVLRIGSSLETVASLTRLDPSEIKRELVAELSTYPEQDLKQKYVHFIVYEKGKWLFEGEDRNRAYFWSTTPFYSARFFTYAMNCPDHQKTRYLLYRHFLAKLSRPAAEVADANVGLPPISIWHGLKRAGYFALYGEWLPSSVKMQLKARFVTGTPYSYDPHSTIVSCLRDQLGNCKALRVYLSGEALDDMIDNCRDHSKYELDNLLSVTSFIECLERGRSTIEQYYDAYFV